MRLAWLCRLDPVPMTAVAAKRSSTFGSHIVAALDQVCLVTERLRDRGWVQPAFHTPLASEREPLAWYRRHRSTPAERAAVRAVARGAAIEAQDDQWRRKHNARAAASRHGAARRRLQRRR